MKMKYWMMVALLASGPVLAQGSTAFNGAIEQRPIDGKLGGFEPGTKGGIPNIEQRPIDGKLGGFEPDTKGGVSP